MVGHPIFEFLRMRKRVLLVKKNDGRCNGISQTPVAKEIDFSGSYHETVMQTTHNAGDIRNIIGGGWCTRPFNPVKYAHDQQDAGASFLTHIKN